MDTRTEAKLNLKVKRKGHPIGRLGAHIKEGMNMTFAGFFREYDRCGLRRVGEAKIRP